MPVKKPSGAAISATKQFRINHSCLLSSTMASLSNRRSMFIDDNFDDVQYSGNWFLDTYERPGPFQFVGMTAKRTAHGTNTTGGFAFSFEGKSSAFFTAAALVVDLDTRNIALNRRSIQRHPSNNKQRSYLQGRWC